MKITEAVRGAWRRVAGVSSGNSAMQIAKRRRTSALPSIFNSYGPLSEAMPKPTPYNLRRFSETPIARRAINCIKDRIAGMRWRIQPRQGYALEAIPEGAARVQLLTDNFNSPNPDDSFRSLAEQVLEDIIVGGFGAIEVQLSPGWEQAASLRSPGRTNASVPTQPIFPTQLLIPAQTTPLLLWPVDGASIRMNCEWDGSPQSQRYMQVNDQTMAN